MIGHVNFMLFVSFLFAFGGQRKCSFWWNMHMGWKVKSSEITAGPGVWFSNPEGNQSIDL